VDNQRNMILAIVLSALVLFGWSALSDRFFPTANPQSAKIENGQPVAIPKPEADPAADSPVAIRDRAVVLAEAPRVRIDTPRLQGSINLKGARIDDLTLTQYRESLAKKSPPIRLLSPGGAKDAYFAGFGWTGEGVAVPTAQTVWQADGAVLSPGKPVTLRWDNGQGQRFQIRLAVDANYMFTAEQTVANTGAGAVALRSYALVSRTGASKDPDSWTNHAGPMGVFNGAANYSVNYKDLVPGTDQRFATTGGWVGFTDKYWLTAVMPDQKANVSAGFRAGAGSLYQAEFSTEPTIVAPGKAARTTARVFAGAKEVALLDNYEDALGIAQLD
jgi:YidC/Oxa1 family membrane protein insertase